jgi:hypothetical protein
MIDVQEIEILASALADAVDAEMRAKQELNALEESLAIAKARVIYDSYINGDIDGKNAEQRAAQETVALDNNDSIGDLRGLRANAVMKLIEASVQHTLIETRVTLTKAWLYSTSAR